MAHLNTLVAGLCVCCKKCVFEKRTSIQIESISEESDMPNTLEFAGTDQFYEITKIDKLKRTNETQLILVRKDYSSLLKEVDSIKQTIKMLKEKIT